MDEEAPNHAQLAQQAGRLAFSGEDRAGALRRKAMRISDLELRRLLLQQAERIELQVGGRRETP